MHSFPYWLVSHLVGKLKNTVYLLGSPDNGFNNLGDFAQLIGINKFLLDNYLDHNIVVVPFKDSLRFVEKLNLHKLHDRDVFFIQSGGHFGDFSKGYNALRYALLTQVRTNLVVQLPVNVYYKPDSKRLELDVGFYETRHNFVCLGRSNYDSVFIRETLKIESCFCPDFAFYNYYGDPFEIGISEHKLLMSLRCDFESDFSGFFGDFGLINKLPDDLLRKDLQRVVGRLTGKVQGRLVKFMVKKSFEKFGFNVTVADPNIVKTPVLDVEKRILETVNYYRQFSLVFTNRFHSKVFSLIAETPYLFSLNKTKGKAEKLKRPYPKDFLFLRGYLNNYLPN